jgi:hypothetical protein
MSMYALVVTSGYKNAADPHIRAAGDGYSTGWPDGMVSGYLIFQQCCAL